ncbi:MAG: PEP-CTERM sorting domain-containing protein [Verrucomicrobiales bacterium]
MNKNTQLTALALGAIVLAQPAASFGATTAYNSAVLASNPSYYWNFDEAGVTNALEQKNGDPADVFAPSAASAKTLSTSTGGGVSLGQALDLDRTTTSVWNTGNLSGAAFAGAWAVEVWINSANPEQYNYIVGANASNGYNVGSILQFSNLAPDPGTPHIFVYPAWPGTTATALQTPGWNHWVFVNEQGGGGSDVYQNGVFLGGFQAGLSIDPFLATEVRAGGWSPTAQPENFTGQIDELAYYDLAGLDAAGLSAKGLELAGHYNVVPEPSVALLLLASAGCLFRRRR